MSVTLIHLPRIAADHPLVAYAHATSVAKGATAIMDAQKAGWIAEADLRVTAAKLAKTQAFATLPPADAFTLQVKALRDLAEVDELLEPFKEQIPDWENLPAAWRAAYDRLTTAQEARVQACRLILLRQEPYYRHYLRALNVTPDISVPTACVDTEFCIRYNPGFFANLNLSQLAFVLLHEAEHVAYRHITRSAPLRPSFKAKDRKAWHALTNIAADLEILMRQIASEKKGGKEGTLLAANIPNTLTSDSVKADGYTFDADWMLSRDYKLPANLVVSFEKGFFEKFATDLFAAVCETTAAERAAYDAEQAVIQTLIGGSSGPGGPGDAPAANRPVRRTLIGFDPAENATEVADHDTRVSRIRAEADADQTAREKSRGMGHGGDEHIVVPVRPTPFSAYVERLAGTSHAMRGTRPAWTRPAYYSYVTGTFEPARTRIKEPILFAFDTSGSISHRELSFAFNCLHGYALQNLFSTVDLMLWDTQVSLHATLTAPPDLSKLRIARGGTTMSSVADYLDANPGIPRPKLTVYVTDGCVESCPRVPGGRVVVLCTHQASIAALEKSLPNATVLWVDINE